MDVVSYAKASSAYKLATLVNNELVKKANVEGSGILVPVGTTATRPVLSLGESAIRYNSDLGGLEEWTGTEWKNVSASISAVSLKGKDTEANILAKVGMVAEDLWIASDTLDGWVYDGDVWINIGPLQGPQGIQGVQGIQGIQGIQGDIGPKGNTGIQGIQGIQGEKGDTGDTGPKGDKGDKGDTGAQGIQGEIGLQGPQGPIGETGPQGPIGETGAGLVVKSTDTVANILLKSGVEGDFWIASDTGDGYSYVSGSWVNTGQVRGPQGEQGDQGIQGETGPKGVTGNGVASIVKTATLGLIDTYTVTFTDATTTTFNVSNGLDGLGVDHIAKTSGTGAAGTVDVYTVWGDVAETINLGTFNVYNGANGAGTVSGVTAGTNVTVDNTDPTNPIVGLGVNVTVQGNTFNGPEQLVKLEVDGKLPVLDGSNLTGIDGLPDQTGFAGKYLKTDGTIATWESANNYVHPENHSPSIITQDTDNRFVTDTEKSTWNAKQDTLVSGTSIKTINGTSVLGSGNIVTPTTTLASVAPLIAGTAAVGVSTAVARQDHVHPAQTTITGNAATATKLAATKTISGVAFDGSANINIEDRLGTPIASAATTTVGTAGLGDYVHITGTTTITSLGTATTAGIRRTLIFDGALTLTHNATSLICVGAENIVTVAGTVIEVVAETTANWRVVSVTHPSVKHQELGYLTGTTSAIQTQLNAKAPLVSPSFTTPVLGVATGISFNSITGLASVAPLADGTATVGTSTLAARQDHVHPSDATKQGTLVSGTNIKTINGSTVLGSGDLTVTASNLIASVTTASAVTNISLTGLTLERNVPYSLYLYVPSISNQGGSPKVTFNGITTSSYDYKLMYITTSSLTTSTVTNEDGFKLTTTGSNNKFTINARICIDTDNAIMFSSGTQFYNSSTIDDTYNLLGGVIYIGAAVTSLNISLNGYTFGIGTVVKLHKEIL